MKTSLAKLALTLAALTLTPAWASAQILLTGGDSTDGVNLSTLGTEFGGFYAVNSETGQSAITLQGETFVALSHDTGGTNFITATPNGGFNAATTADTATNANFTNPTTPSTNDTALLSLVNTGFYQTAPAGVALQVFNLAHSTAYTFTLFMSADGNTGLTNSETVTTTDGTGGSSTATFGGASTVNDIYELSYTATSDASGTLKIAITSNTASPAFLDAGLVTLAITPEPSTWAMLLGGMGALGFLIRARKLVRA